MKTKMIHHGLGSLSYPVGAYIAENLPNIKIMVESFKSIAALKKNFNRGINLICRGSSGAIVATVFAMELAEYRTKIVHIKKEGESAHNNDCKIIIDGLNVIVDDFICSGKTLNTIYEVYTQNYPNAKIDALCVTGGYSKLNFEPKYYFCGWGS